MEWNGMRIEMEMKWKWSGNRVEMEWKLNTKSFPFPWIHSHISWEE
jgi:hypothetical protein